MSKPLIAAAGAGLAALLLAAPMPATAAGTTPTVTKVSNAVGAPFNLDVSRHRVLVADGGANAVLRLKSDGTTATVVESEGASGVARSRNGRYLAYTGTVGGPGGITASSVSIRGPKGTVVADTLAYEKANNPDKKLTYGVDNPSDCVTQALTEMQIPVKYTGAIDSHAYSLAAWGKKFVLADAGGNDLLSIDRKGHISTIAVMPRQPLRITAGIAKTLGLPDCVVDVTYSFESVPTDVEVGRDGWLYVTTLPGGPEDPSLGARGRVYKVNPKTGEKHVVARGLAGATNLALGKHGEIYVTELFAGRVSVIKDGVVKPWVDLPGAVSVETDRHGTVWAGTLGNEQGPGTVVTISTKHHHPHS